MQELMKILRSNNIDKNELFKIIPELLPCQTCLVNHPAHKYNILDHSLAAVKLVDTTLLKLVLLLHDIGKPNCLKIDEEGITHFWEHQKESVQISHPILDRLEVESRDKKTILTLINYHDTKIDSDEDMKRICDEIGIGPNGIKMLLTVQKSDLLTHADWYAAKKMHLIEEEQALFNKVYNLLER